MKIKKYIILAFLPFFMLSGCSGVKQIHERLIIQGIGIDKNESEYILTVQAFDTKSDSSESEGNVNSEVISSSGKSISEAFSNISKQNGQEPLYSQNLVLVVGRDTAKVGIENIIDFFVRYYEFRPMMNVFISDEPAYKILSSKEDDKLVTAQNIADLSRNEDLSSSTVNSTLLDCVSSLKSDIDDFGATFLGNKNGSLASNGMAVFNGGKFSGTLNEDETRGFLLLSKKVKNLEKDIYINGIGNVTYNVVSSRSKIEADVIDGIPKFNINVYTKVGISEVGKISKNNLSTEDFENINNEIKQDIYYMVDNSIKKALIEYNSDIFRFSKLLKRDQTKYFRTIESSPKEVLKKAEYNINVNSEIKKIGQESDLF